MPEKLVLIDHVLAACLLRDPDVILPIDFDFVYSKLYTNAYLHNYSIAYGVMY